MTNRDLGAPDLSVQTRTTDALSSFSGIRDLALAGYTFFGRKPTDVPLYGDLRRDQILRRLWTMAGAEPIQGAISAIIQKIQSTSWFIEGPVKVARRVHSMLHNADFGSGWEAFLARVILDYLTQDNGMFIEILGEGPKDAMLDGAALGIAQLDSHRCTRTGDLEYPVLYTDVIGKRHKLHWSRVYFQSDLPSPIEERLGIGFCALSRCVASAQAIIAWSEMRNEMLDDMPVAGILAIDGVNKEAFDEQLAKYEADRRSKEQDVYRGVITLFNANPAVKMNVQLHSFRQVWEGFEEAKLYDSIIDLVAMAFGIDRQEIAPLATSALGSGAQSTVLSQKSRGKGIGNILSLIERFINRITPQSVTFRFDFQDDEQDKMQAEIRQLKASTIVTLYTAQMKQPNIQMDNTQVAEPVLTTQPAEAGLLSRVEARYLLAKEGIIPRELLLPEERLNPEWEKFDDITMKAVKRYGSPARVLKSGELDSRLTFYGFRRKLARGVVWEHAS